MDLGKRFFNQICHTAVCDNSFLVVKNPTQPEIFFLVLILSMNVTPSKRKKSEGQCENVEENEQEDGKNINAESKDGDEGVTTNQLWSEFLHSLTLHGFRFIFEEGPKVRKCFWLVILLLAIFMLILQIKKSIQKYFERPITTSVQVEFLDEMVFPAVTICNFNLFPYYLINGTIGEKVSYRVLSAKSTHLLLLFTLTLLHVFVVVVVLNSATYILILNS